MPRNNQRSGKNNNSEGRNQFNNGFFDSARDRPVAAAAAAAAAVGAGVFLWSRRNQISGQISNLSEQFSDWSGSREFSGGQSGDFEFEGSETTSSAIGSSGSSRGGKRSGGKSGGGQGQAFGGTATGSGTAS